MQLKFGNDLYYQCVGYLFRPDDHNNNEYSCVHRNGSKSQENPHHETENDEGCGVFYPGKTSEKRAMPTPCPILLVFLWGFKSGFSLLWNQFNETVTFRYIAKSLQC